MKRIIPALLCIAIGAGFTLGAGQLGISLAHADTPALADAGASSAAGSAGSAAKPTPITPHDPTANPGAYISDLQVAYKDGWPVLVFLIAFGIAEVLAWAGKNVKALAALGKGRVSVVIGGAVAVLTAVIAAASGGAAWLSVIIAAGTTLLAYWHPAGTDPAKA